MSRIFVHITIDTESVRESYPTPSQDSEKPTGILHTQGFMVVKKARVISGQGTGDLHFRAAMGDDVRFFGSSVSNNFDDGVLVYALPRFAGDKVLGEFESVFIENRPGIVPSSRSSVLPGKNHLQHFWYYDTRVIGHGKESYQVRFALYKRANGGNHELFGYYYWDPTITVG